MACNESVLISLLKTIMIIVYDHYQMCVKPSLIVLIIIKKIRFGTKLYTKSVGIPLGDLSGLLLLLISTYFQRGVTLSLSDDNHHNAFKSTSA